MTVDIKYDQRYKVTPEIVAEMRKMRKEGKTFQYIADYFDVGSFTAYYWCVDSYRKKKRKQNCMGPYPRHNQEEKNKFKTRRRFELRNVPEVRTMLRFQSAKNEYRCKRHTVIGMPIDEFFKEYEKTKKGGNKIGI